MERICVLGAGSWGTALAHLFAQNVPSVRLWVRSPELCRVLRERRENPTYLPGIPLSERIEPTTSFAEALADAEVVFSVVPSHATRGIVRQIVPHLREGVPIVSASKGIENETLMTVSQIMRSELPPPFHPEIAVLAGPSFAREVASGVPTAVVLAGTSPRNVEIQHTISTPHFRVYTSRDMIGVELAGALKNVIAIAAGICDGMGLGHNTRAALITRGIAEMTRLGRVLGANPLTFAGLAGLGDLILTCTGDLSRNRQVGLKLGAGRKLREILAEMRMVAEGVKTT
ncbi:MAG: NAD(P)-dependent glycerol-3-phosphate dehydrogenase, partial [Deltaproteobacteria bacterium]